MGAAISDAIRVASLSRLAVGRLVLAAVEMSATY
jgi:hypothetical protein